MDCRRNEVPSGSIFSGRCNEIERTEESAADRGSKSVAGGQGFKSQAGGAPNKSTQVLGWSSQREGAREAARGSEMSKTKRKQENEDEIGHSITCAAAQLSRKRSNDARIVRVSRTSGGKDRHSKVLTAKGLRDRRVRLSVSTAIQFYDLQDRLGFDQPSKAVEWLIKAAADAIDELPVLDTSEIQIHHRRHAAAVAGSGGSTIDAGPKDNALIVPFEAGAAINAAESSTNDSHSSKEGQCDEVLAVKSSSSTSEQDGSKGHDFSTVSRSESRVNARKRARERTMEKFSGSTLTSNISSNCSFPGVLAALGNLRNYHPSDKYRAGEDLVQFQYKRHDEAPPSSHWGNDIADDDAGNDHRHLMAVAAMQPSPSSAATSSSIAAILGHLNLHRNPEVVTSSSSAHASAQQKHSVVSAAFATANSNNNSPNSFLLSSIDHDALVQEHFAANPAISNDMNLMISMPGLSGRETLQSNSSTYLQLSPSHIQRMPYAEASQFIFTNVGDAHFEGFHHARAMDRVRQQFTFNEGSRDSLHDLKGNRSKHGQH